MALYKVSHGKHYTANLKTIFILSGAMQRYFIKHKRWSQKF